MSGKFRRELTENFVRGTDIPPKPFHYKVVERITGRVAVVMVDESARRPGRDHGKRIVGIFSRSAAAVRTADESRGAQYERRQKTTEFFENGFHKFSSLNLFELKIQSN